jgi:hypothetical protein
MKELSIEEKAKRYDDLLVKLQKAKVDNNVCDERYCCVIDDIVPELKESEDERIRKWLVEELYKSVNSSVNKGFDIDMGGKALAWLEKQDKQKEYTFKSLPRLLEMIEPTNKAKAYCQKLIDSLIEEGYSTDAKIVGERLKQMNGEDVPMAVMDENKGEEKTPNMDRIKEKAHQIAWENSKSYDPTLSKESWCEIAALEMAYWLEKQKG